MQHNNIVAPLGFEEYLRQLQDEGIDQRACLRPWTSSNAINVKHRAIPTLAVDLPIQANMHDAPIAFVVCRHWPAPASAGVTHEILLTNYDAALDGVSRKGPRTFCAAAQKGHSR